MVQTTYTQGTTAIDKTREADNKYQLNTIDGNTGWTLLSEMGRQVLFLDEFKPVPIFPYSISPPYSPGPTNVINNTWSIVSLQPNTNWEIVNGNVLQATQVGQPALVVVDLLTDGEIKTLIMLLNGTGTFSFGIVFRLLDKYNYWRFYFEHTSTGISIRLQNIINGSVGNVDKTDSTITLGTSNFFTLAVKMKGNFIAVYYNELMIWSILDNFNNSYSKHGLVALNSASKYSCYNYKFFK